ncbi:MAG: GGDEF domain-containing protein [Pseudomonadota bacterium]
MSDDFRTTQQFFDLNIEAGQEGNVSLVVIRGEPFGKSFPLASKPVVIGRSSSCDIQFGDASVSRRQCRIVPQGGAYVIVDYQSTNPTRVNGDPVTQCQLKDGDRIALGPVVLKFVASDPVESAYHVSIYDRAMSDPLTGIANRRTFFEVMKRALKLSARQASPLSVAVLDLDRFKSVNDDYDHLVGDQVLLTVADLASRQCVGEELIARLGGEEFGVILPGLTLEQAADRMESLRHTIARSPLTVEGREIPVTVSIGVAQFRPAMRNPAAFVRAADRALLEAKGAGRNCVRLADPA